MTAPNSLTIIRDPVEMRQISESARASGALIGVVPTMGALHAGHLSLVERSVAANDVTIVTIFVNPTQFGPDEDLDRYPRREDDDVGLLQAAGVNYVFAPEAKAMYPNSDAAMVSPGGIARMLEGEFRPGHFAGVATVVLKLLNITAPHTAYFGQKDYQQAMVIRHMVRDFEVPATIEVCPIIRDPDGLAMSSRNVYLDPRQRAIALSIFQTLDDVESRLRAGESDAVMLVEAARQRLVDAGVTSIDYVAVADPDTLRTHDPVVLPAVVLIAAWVGQTRLIDNRVVG